MGWRFRRQIKIAPGFKVNVSKSGTSLSIGERGATLNIGRHGETVTTGIPGTGLSYRKRIGKIRPVHRHSLLSVLLVLAVLWMVFGHH